MKKIKKLSFYFQPRLAGLVSLLLITVPLGLIFANGETGSNPPPDIDSMNPLRANTFYEFIEMILQNIVVPIGTIIAVLAIIYSGFLFVTAQGNTEQLTRARSAFFWAVIGGLILLGAWAIAVGIENTIRQITTTDN